MGASSTQTACTRTGHLNDDHGARSSPRLRPKKVAITDANTSSYGECDARSAETTLASTPVHETGWTEKAPA